MTASPDDAAASAVPPRADGGPAAPSFPGTPGRRPPEDSPMSQRPTLTDDRLPDDTVKYEPVPDETVRMRADGPAPDGGPAVRPVDAADDTRPVIRDWLLGAPDIDPGSDPSPAPSTPAPPPRPPSPPPPRPPRPTSHRLPWRPTPRPTTGTPRRSTARPTSTLPPRTTTRPPRPPPSRTRSTATGPRRPAGPRPETSRLPEAPGAPGGAVAPSSS